MPPIRISSSMPGRLLALWEGGPPYELEPSTLDTIGVYDFNGKLQGAMTAHPKVDPETGELLFFGYGPFPPLSGATQSSLRTVI